MFQNHLPDPYRCWDPTVRSHIEKYQVIIKEKLLAINGGKMQKT